MGLPNTKEIADKINELKFPMLEMAAGLKTLITSQRKTNELLIEQNALLAKIAAGGAEGK